MIGRFSIASIALGLLLLVGGIFLGEGYSAKRGFLESLPRMKVRLTAGQQHAQFFEVLKSEIAAGPLIEFEGKLIQMAYEMGEAEVSRVLTSFDAQRLGVAKPEHKFFFAGWAVQPGTTIPLGPMLAIASALIIVGAAVLSGTRLRNQQTTSAQIVRTEQTIQPEPSHVQTPIKGSRMRLALHLWGGVCLKAAADVSQILAVRGGRDVESASAAAAGAGLAAVLLIAAGYYLSYQLASVLDKSSLSPVRRKTIFVLLPIAYFVGAILLGGVVGLVTGTAR